MKFAFSFQKKKKIVLSREKVVVNKKQMMKRTKKNWQNVRFSKAFHSTFQLFLKIDSKERMEYRECCFRIFIKLFTYANPSFKKKISFLLIPLI